MTNKHILATMLSLLIISGCASKVEKYQAQHHTILKLENIWRAMRQNQNEGSLWTDMKSNGALFLDYKARNIGI